MLGWKQMFTYQTPMLSEPFHCLIVFGHRPMNVLNPLQPSLIKKKKKKAMGPKKRSHNALLNDNH